MTAPASPQAEKARTIKHISQEQGLFIDWLRATHGLVLCKLVHDTEEDEDEHDEHECNDRCEWSPAGIGDGALNRLLAEYHGIDYDAMEAEKRALLDWIRAGYP